MHVIILKFSSPFITQYICTIGLVDDITRCMMEYDALINCHFNAQPKMNKLSVLPRIVIAR